MAVSPPKVQGQRDAGIAFHEDRAADAVQGNKPGTLLWIFGLVAAAILLLQVYSLRVGAK